MKYLSKPIGLLVILIILLTGCINDLDLINPNQMSSESLTASKSDLNLQLMGCYDALQQEYTFGRWARDLDGIAATAYFINSNFKEVSQGYSTPESPLYQGYWVAWYKAVVRCNDLIGNIDETGSTDATETEIKAEAMFIRALSYFYIMTLYKDAPYITKKQLFDERFVAVDSEATIKAGILSDLDFAIANLPVDQPQGKAGKAAAMALKMRTHLYFNEMAEVVTLTQQVMALNKYKLFADYTTLFFEVNEINKESLFSVAFASGIGEGEYFSGSFVLQPVTTWMCPLQSFTDLFYCTDGLPNGKPVFLDTPLKGQVSPLFNAAKFYQNRDPRYDVSILRVGEPVANGSAWVATRRPTGYAFQKYNRTWESLYTTDGPVDFMVFRYAEILLSRAEALLATQGMVPEVYSLINQVRARVNIPTIQAVEEAKKGSALNAGEMLQVIKHEIFVELGGEGVLWFDLKRWGDVEKVYQAIASLEKLDPRVFRGDKTLYWPIPQVEIDNNPNLIQHRWWSSGN